MSDDAVQEAVEGLELLSFLLDLAINPIAEMKCLQQCTLETHTRHRFKLKLELAKVPVQKSDLKLQTLANWGCKFHLSTKPKLLPTLSKEHSANKAIDTPTNGSASKKSNVDVGQQNKKDKCKDLKCGAQLAHLQTSLAALEEKIIMYSVKTLQEKGQVGNKAFSLLDKAIMDIKQLESEVEFLEVEALDLKEELDSAHHRITTHERVIQRLSGPEQDDLVQQYNQSTQRGYRGLIVVMYPPHMSTELIYGRSL
ncbi:uncharacterized protein MELLADRAFT_104032 [Melampsora larici-populina 98AG31]|uniref:Uncharacterized protein n=1 Tax=Melampsora larici-populina (strain 98AG31 / pathotype 3-4-7) TaxID=747676 RepID=F4RDC1_MELLP|nr:uncharacterized protein MELLADRAFT_104032 [Melampsora larici-populina 98AG31]EGG09633.1 hypothetical protein MELLADRAFT_104032 [Melampsora larici-populina 98AG31]